MNKWINNKMTGQFMLLCMQLEILVRADELDSIILIR